MVFQSNHARRASNSENVYPSSYRRSSSKRYSSFRNGAQSPSRRRRARTTGNNNPRSPVQRSYRRAITRTSTAAVRFDIAREVTDVEVNDTETRGEAGSSSQKTPITLPRWLDRPNYREVRRETLVAIDPEFVDVPLEYIQIGLESTGLAMMQVLSSVEATPVKNSLPKELTVMVNNFSSDMPTHMLAVYSRQSSVSPNPTRRVMLFPTHNIVMALYCAHLPMLPKSTATEPDSVGQMTLPVIPLCVPSPETFSRLSSYLYTKDASHLLSMLLPTGMLTPISLLTLGDMLDAEDMLDADAPEVQQFSNKLRATYTPHALLTHAMTINGLWRNVCALGIFDARLWEVLDLAWDIVIGALEGKDEANQ